MGAVGAISVLVADDHPVFRAAVVRGLEAGGLEVIGEAGDGATALALLRDRRPQVAVLDVRMPEPDGIELTRLLAQEGLGTRALLLSAYAEGSLVHAALAAGAAGYLLKDADEEEIVQAVRAVAQGKSMLSPQLHTAVFAQIRQETGPETGLSVREHEILRCVAAGLTTAQIAERLFLSSTTVKTYLQRLYDKLGVSDRSAAVAEAMRRGWLQ